MDRDGVIALMAKVKGKVSERVYDAINEILSLATPFTYLGAKFTFDVDGNLDKEVNQLLIQLSDKIIEDSDTMALQAVKEEDKNDVLAYIHREINGQDITARMDSHSSHLKYLLEGYFAVCFAKGLSNGYILGNVPRYLANPNNFSLMRDAFKHSQDYASRLISDIGFHFGKGSRLNPIDGFAINGQTYIYEAYIKEMLIDFDNEGAIGYNVYRGSSFPCPECDDVCFNSDGSRILYSLDECPLPVHPNCVCWLNPVYKSQ